MTRHSEGLPSNDCGIRPGVTLIEAVPNVSEGRRTPVIQALASAVRGQPGVTLLDVSSDVAHNRTVFTLVGPPNGLHSALLSLYAVAIEAIDLRSHTGEHPRIGAVDVVPLVPLAVADMGVCVSTATALAAAVAARFDMPVYLYGRAARVPEREQLEVVRRGEFEGLASKMSGHSWCPDFGPVRPHPSAGASAIGARKILIAFNVNLRTATLDIARQIARGIRASSGGLPAVKAIGVRTEDPEIVQVSINLVDHETTALHTVFAAVEDEARRRGIVVEGSEIVGLAPAGALLSTAAHCLGLPDVTMDQVLDWRLPR